MKLMDVIVNDRRSVCSAIYLSYCVS